MSSDKKVRSGQIRMVLTPAAGQTRVEVVEEPVLRVAWETLTAGQENSAAAADETGRSAAQPLTGTGGRVQA